MESQPLRLCGIRHLFTEFLPEARVPRVEVIYPQPHRAVKVPTNTMLDCSGSLSTMTKCVLPVQQGDHNSRDFFDAFFDKDETGDNQTDFFCGSPPVRTTNPVVRDALFTKVNTGFSPTAIHESSWTQARVEQSPRSCSSSFDKKKLESMTDRIISASSVPGLVVSALS